MIKIDWNSNESHILINPKSPLPEKHRLLEMLSHFDLQGHVFLATSGSTAISSQDIKWVALKKETILISSASVNRHLQCTKDDILLNPLPHFHIGGLSFFSRSHLSGAKLIDLYSEEYKWNPFEFKKQLEENKVTISSLVPTQLYDIVQKQITAPSSLRCIVIGGGALSKNLYEKGKKLGWKCLPSYGMTECCSQVATAALDFQWEGDFPQLTILPHLSVHISHEGQICISGDSLLSGYIFQKENSIEFQDPKINKKIITTDLGEVKENHLIVYGRENNVVKINGENVSLDRLDHILSDIRIKLNIEFDAAIFPAPDDRSGYKIQIVFPQSAQQKLSLIQQIITEFNNVVFPFEKIQEIHFMDRIPRTDLGKLKRNLLSKNQFTDYNRKLKNGSVF